MPMRARTYQAKTYVPVVSAAIDPYEEARNSLVDDERLDQWFRYVEAELRRYRSPFVAAEALLTEMRQFNAQLYQPERLYVNSALRILQACVPHLSRETADVVSAAIHELLPCLVYTRWSPICAGGKAEPPSSSLALLPPLHAPLEQVAQLTYAGAFRRILARWHHFQAQLKQQERYVRVEVKVMDRVVHELDHMWVKTCFYSWRTYCRQLRVRKAQLRRRLARATANESAPRFLRAWRQYAHTIALDAKTNRAGALQQEVEALYPLEHEAKSRHDHLTEEIKEKNRLTGESLQRLEETQERLRVLEELIDETQRSLTDHWSTWKNCMLLLFEDVGKLPGKSDRTVRTDYLMNITDTASYLEKRARTKAGRQDLQHIGKLLLYENALGIEGDYAMDDSAPGSGGERRMNSGGKCGVGHGLQVAAAAHSGSTVKAVAVAKGKHHHHPASRALTFLTPTAVGALVSDVNRVYAAVAAVARPVLSPLHLTDVLHHNEPRLSLTLAFLATLYSGGHCSLFVPALRLKRHRDPNKGSAAPAEAEGASAEKDGQAAPDGEEVHWGARMVQDVSDGMRKVQRCADANERYLMSVRQCMMGSELDVIQGYLEDLYARWASTGVPLSQTKLESVWEPIVTAMELPIIKALYPAQGILNFSELVDYVTRVAEFSGRPLMALVERLDATYPYDPLDELHILRHSDEAADLFRDYAAPVTLLCDWLRDETTPSQFNPDHLSALLEEELGLNAAEVAEARALVQRDGGGVIERDDVEWLLLVVAPYVDPSPFSSPLEKTEAVLLQCGPLFAQLQKKASAAKAAARK